MHLRTRAKKSKCALKFLLAALQEFVAADSQHVAYFEDNIDASLLYDNVGTLVKDVWVFPMMPSQT